MIRLATERDFPEILDLAAEFWRHTQFTEPFCRDHCLKMVEMCHSQGLLSVVDDGSVIGFAAGVMAQSLAAPSALVGTEVAWWINPSIRGAGYGIMLLDFMEDLARDLGIKYWNMVAMESSMPNQVKSMYLDRGYTLQESTFTKVL